MLYFFSQLQFLVLLYTNLSAPSLLPFASISHYQLLLLADTSPASKLSSSREDNCFKEIQFTVSSTRKEHLKPGKVTDLGNQIKSTSNISLDVMSCFYFWLFFRGCKMFWRGLLCTGFWCPSSTDGVGAWWVKTVMPVIGVAIFDPMDRWENAQIH